MIVRSARAGTHLCGYLLAFKNGSVSGQEFGVYLPSNIGKYPLLRAIRTLLKGPWGGSGRGLGFTGLGFLSVEIQVSVLVPNKLPESRRAQKVESK